MKKPTIKDFEKDYKNDPKKFLKPIEEQIGGKIVSVNFIEDTTDFYISNGGIKGV
jgi:hypothetical protein